MYRSEVNTFVSSLMNSIFKHGDIVQVRYSDELNSDGLPTNHRNFI